jgi:hypothetical protein
MAEIGRSHVWKAREDMSLPDHRRPLPERLKGKAPVRVKLEPINCDVSRSLPPEGDRQVWLDRLMAALGTSSIEFVDATLYQLQAAARLPNSGVSEIAVNASLAFIEGERPRGEMECAIVVQLACLHAASMNVLGRLSAAWAIVTSWRRQPQPADCRALLQSWSRPCAGKGVAVHRSSASNGWTFGMAAKLCSEIFGLKTISAKSQNRLLQLSLVEGCTDGDS